MDRLSEVQTWHGVVIKAKKYWRGVRRPRVAMHSQLPRFLVYHCLRVHTDVTERISTELCNMFGSESGLTAR